MNDVLNNIQISAYHNSNAPIRLGLYFNAGALLQPKGKEGLSHLLEHVVANNVNNGTNEYVQAFTTKQEIYFIVVSYDSSFLKNSYEKICKIIRSGNYTNSTVQNEKLSVKNELSNIENDYPNNNQIILHDFLATKSQNTNIYGLVEGSHETLSGITLEDLRTHQKNFLQKPSSIVITGNINVNKELPSILTKPFSKFDNNEPVINRLNTSSLTENITLEDHILKTPRDTPFLGIGWSTPFIDAKTFIAQMIGLNALINPTNSYYNKTRGNLNIHDLALDHDIIFKQQVIFSIHTKISKAYIKHFISTLNNYPKQLLLNDISSELEIYKLAASTIMDGSEHAFNFMSYYSKIGISNEQYEKIIDSLHVKDIEFHTNNLLNTNYATVIS